MRLCGCRVSTRFFRFGSGWPRLSNVLRPMTTTLPIVIFLNHLKSSGRCHGILLPAPITRFCDIAAMALKCFILLSADYTDCADKNQSALICEICGCFHTAIGALMPGYGS